MSVDITLRKSDGQVLAYEIFPSVIASNARLSYDQAQALIDSAPHDLIDAFRKEAAPFGAVELDDEMILQLAEKVKAAKALSERLYERRYAAGCMEFNRVEARAILDDHGAPTGIRYRKRTEATKLIEEAMILANHLVASWLSERSMPCIYRTHDAPARDALFSFYEILQEFDAYRTIDKNLFCAGNPHVLQQLLATPADEQTHELVSMLLLRSMKRAAIRSRMRAITDWRSNNTAILPALSDAIPILWCTVW